jgi:flagellar basal-body rod modification protein FlgD
MEITPTTAGTTSTTGKKSETTEASTSIGGDFQTFLTLLTTQMRNQDPLKPMESTEFVAQLASFSSVEQQVRANDRLEGILAALAGGNAAGLAEWIGREVRAPAKASFAGEPIEVGIEPMADADKAVLVVRNDFDQVVARRTVDVGADKLSWDGLDDMGNPLPHGRYGFALESYEGETLLGTQTASVFTTVQEVRIVDGAPVLVVEGGEQVALDDVDGVR